jgi:excisionase family DNA binding protein
MNDDFLTVAEAAAIIRVTTRTVWNLVRRDAITIVRPAGLRVTLVKADSVRQLLSTSRPAARVMRNKGGAKWII